MDSRKDEEATIKVASIKKSVTPSRPQVFGKIKLKKAPPKQAKPGNWKEANVIEEDKKKSKDNAITAASPSPVTIQLDDASRENFQTGRPLEDQLDMFQCKHCKKVITRSAGVEHVARCLKIKKEKAQRKKEAREARERMKEAVREQERKAEGDGAGRGDDDSDDDDEIKDGNAGKTTGKAKKTNVAGKKRKAEGELDKGKAKKKKDEPKPKAAKPKGPVDVERQCGVLLPNGQPCARSLTCKSHSMSAKRAVPGRSLPYDMLLAAYQKKNQAKQQKAAIDANAPLEDEDEANQAAVDSDEETAAVMSALANWNPQPVVPQPVFAPTKRQYQLARLHEQLHTATNGGRVNIFQVVGYGAQRLPEGHPGLLENEDAPGESDPAAMGGDFSRRSSLPDIHATQAMGTWAAMNVERQKQLQQHQPEKKVARYQQLLAQQQQQHAQQQNQLQWVTVSAQATSRGGSHSKGRRAYQQAQARAYTQGSMRQTQGQAQHQIAAVRREAHAQRRAQIRAHAQHLAATQAPNPLAGCPTASITAAMAAAVAIAGPHNRRPLIPSPQLSTAAASASSAATAASTSASAHASTSASTAAGRPQPQMQGQMQPQAQALAQEQAQGGIKQETG
ncbi:SCA7, zinc-binding domain-containing protein [Chaetomium tenue]|uniref:SCA7, zinc-binding domain-containing protein n=1 Tax=Chaetomium tenue TaxID=1854479 RepID=A0ACB7PB13_9PEZI|nr:SCA7, zinc-binding domain-containing protein [Chaetomium globosum]